MGEGNEAVIAFITCGASVGRHGGEQLSKRQKACFVTAACVDCTFLVMGRLVLCICHTHATAVPLPPGLHSYASALLSFLALPSTNPSAVREAQVALGLSQPPLSSGVVVSSRISPCSARMVAQITGMLSTALSYSLTAPHPCPHGDLCPLRRPGWRAAAWPTLGLQQH